MDAVFDGDGTVHCREMGTCGDAYVFVYCSDRAIGTINSDD